MPVAIKVENDNEDYDQTRSEKSKKIQNRRPTVMPTKKMALTAYQSVFAWWKKASIVYAFSHPQVRSHLEMLMGSNMVSLTDRSYMQKLQERILEHYETSMDKRIAAREQQEMQRVKNLVLTGKIPLDDAPPEMADHPIMLIEMYCRKLIAERRAKMKIPKFKVPNFLYWDDTPDPPSGLSIEKGHVFRKPPDNLCVCPDAFLQTTDEEDIERGHMFTEEEYDKLMFEEPLIKQLRTCETVDEMYVLADEIIGILRTVEKTYDDVSNITAVTM